MLSTLNRRQKVFILIALGVTVLALGFLEQAITHRYGSDNGFSIFVA